MRKLLEEEVEGQPMAAAKAKKRNKKSKKEKSKEMQVCSNVQSAHNKVSPAGDLCCLLCSCSSISRCHLLLTSLICVAQTQ